MRRNSPWRLINRCIICGSKLKFLPSPKKDALEYEGAMVCEHNHRRFCVFGVYNSEGDWETRFYFPRKPIS